MDHICLPKYLRKKVSFSVHRHFPCCLSLALSIIILKNHTWERSSCGSVGKTSEQFNQGESEKYFARSYFWLVSFSHWGSARRKSPQSPTPDIGFTRPDGLRCLGTRLLATQNVFFSNKKNYECPSRHLQFLRRQALPQCGQVAQSRRRIWWRHTSSKRSLCSWWWRSHWRPSAAWGVGASLPAEAPRLPISGSGAPMIWRRGAPQNCSWHGFESLERASRNSGTALRFQSVLGPTWHLRFWEPTPMALMAKLLPFNITQVRERCALCTVLCALCTVQCALYTALCALRMQDAMQ